MERLLSVIRPFSAALALLLLAACAGIGGGAGAPRLGDLTPPPAVLPASDGGGTDALLGGATFDVRAPSLDWGVGVLRPAGATRFETLDLPLFSSPGGVHWGWLTRGAVYDVIRRRTIGDRSDAAVRAADDRALLVLERRSDGWLKVRYGRPDDRDHGLAWTRADLSGARRVAYVDWARLLEGGRGLVFRNAGAPHNLRDGPSRNAAKVALLEGVDFDMAALEIRGDWMRVRVFTPPACAGSQAEDLLLGGRETREQTGWVAWRSDGRGPWVASAAGPRCAAGF